jgi:hypothetical protein
MRSPSISHSIGGPILCQVVMLRWNKGEIDWLCGGADRQGYLLQDAKRKRARFAGQL